MATKATGPCEVLQTNGHTFFLEQGGISYRVSEGHVVPAGLRPVRKRLSVPQLAVPETLSEDGTEFVHERFLEHSCDDDGVLRLKARVFRLHRNF